MNASFINELHCPYCDGRLHLSYVLDYDEQTVTNGCVRCACCEYPIVDGILVLRQLSERSGSDNRAATLVRSGRADLARSFLMAEGSALGGADASRSRPTNRAVASLKAARRRLARAAEHRLPGQRASARPPIWGYLRRNRPEGFSDYLYYRYANPSFVASVALMSLLPRIPGPRDTDRPRYVLDLGCGIGHSTAMMKHLYPQFQYVAADPDFVNLQIMHRFMASSSKISLVCLDAELPLPFATDFFTSIFCLDVFHYIHAKAPLAREMKRTLASGGALLMPHLHNRLMANPTPGIPLEPSDYLKVLDCENAVLRSERQLLSDLQTGSAVRIDVGSRDGIVADANAISLICAGSEGVPCHPVTQALLAADRSNLGPNPIYEVRKRPGSVELEMTWPSTWLKQECADILGLLPRSVSLDAALWDRLLRHELMPADEDSVARLIQQFALVHLPEGYIRRARSHPTKQAR